MGVRQPGVRGEPKPRKEAKAGFDPDDFARKPLSWRMGLVDWGGNWGWAKLDDGHVANLHRQMKNCEGETLAELKHRKRAKPIPITQICREAQGRLPTIGLGDRSELWELRFGYGKWRAWGIVEGSTFNLVWWDPEHTVCKGAEMPKNARRIR